MKTKSLEVILDKLLVLLMLLITPLTLIAADEAEILREIRELMDQDRGSEALEVIEEGIGEHGPTEGLIHSKYSILLMMEKHEEALEVFEALAAQKGETPDLMVDKVRLLVNLERFDEALKLALALDEETGSSSPFSSIFIAQIYTGLEDKDKAFEWMSLSVDRGFVSFNYLLTEEFKSLHDDERLDGIISRIKDNIGIGHPAKDFTTTLLSGESYSLHDQAGNVLLIDFWATWCPPCRKEMPHMMEIYKELHGKGLEIIGISLDSKRESAEKYIKTEKIPWKNAFSGMGWEDGTARLYGVNSIPMYWLIDRKGILRYSFEMINEEMEIALQGLLNE